MTEDKLIEEQLTYLKECCINVGKELSKYSFEWDGKEKNLVTQAMHLNELYEQLNAENAELKALNKQLLENNSIQQWADMYNKKDKEHFDCQLELAKVEEKLEKINEITSKTCANGCKYLEYELEEDGNYYYYCSIAPRCEDGQCENDKTCYYKQLQQLKVETEELKKFKGESTKAFNNLMKMYNDNCDFTGICEQKLEKINEIANKTCKSGCRCIDKTDILQIIKDATND